MNGSAVPRALQGCAPVRSRVRREGGGRRCGNGQTEHLARGSLNPCDRDRLAAGTGQRRTYNLYYLLKGA